MPDYLFIGGPADGMVHYVAPERTKWHHATATEVSQNPNHMQYLRRTFHGESGQKFFVFAPADWSTDRVIGRLIDIYHQHYLLLNENTKQQRHRPAPLAGIHPLRALGSYPTGSADKDPGPHQEEDGGK